MARELIDLYAVMQHIPSITGLDLTWRKDAWEGGYYLDGTKHHKRDKLKIKFWRTDKGCSIWLHEQGGESMILQDWLQSYAGAKDWHEAMEIMKGNATPSAMLTDVSSRDMVSETRYVDKSEYDGCAAFDLQRCPLFVWMAGLFGKERTEEVWRKYHVTTDGYGLAVFWYTNKDGKICKDKRIAYKHDGHRDKDFGGTSRFRTSQGYRERTLFGAHLVRDCASVSVVESEKTALLASLFNPNEVFVATGGKNGVSLFNCLDCKLYPDMDAVEDWANTGKPIVEWWGGHDVGEKDDYGDLIARLKKNEK